MPDLGVARLVPRDPREIVLGVEILEADVPDERPERLDGVDFVALRAHEAHPVGLVGVRREARAAVGLVVVAGVLEGDEARVAQGHGGRANGFASMRIGAARRSRSAPVTPPMLPSTRCRCHRHAASRDSSMPPSIYAAMASSAHASIGS